MTRPSVQTGTRKRADLAKQLVDSRPQMAARAATLPERGSCSICDDPVQVRQVDELLLDRVPQKRIAEVVGRADKTVQRHWTRCRLRDYEVVSQYLQRQTTGLGEDFAKLVRDEAARQLREGKLKVTATHGLTAQGLLDRREERKADRDLMLNLARLLTGSAPRALIEAPVVEGEYRDVTGE